MRDYISRISSVSGQEFELGNLHGPCLVRQVVGMSCAPDVLSISAPQTQSLQQHQVLQDLFPVPSADMA
jgi:hypothetical protein